MPIRRTLAVALLLTGCSGGSGAGADTPDAGDGTGDAGDGADAASVECISPATCAVKWEQAASDKYDSVLGSPTDLAAFLKAVPKGGDLHNHLTGAVYAETYLGWAKADGDCVNTSTFAVVYGSQCSASTQAVPTSGTFYDQIVRAWSMKDFVAGAETGHDHFFATFGKYGTIAGAHHDADVADVMKRASDENEVYVETMLNLAQNTGTLAATVWTQTVTTANLQAFYDALVGNAGFAAAIAADVKVVTSLDGYAKKALGCTAVPAPAACKVGVRYVAQVARTGALDDLFGQLVGAFEMAAQAPQIVALNLSSPEDATTSLKNYDLHMAMLDFLHAKYTTTKKSPLHVTLHAGEVVPKYLPSGYATANTFHVRHAVETGHAERIGHGVDVMSETDPAGLMAEMSQKGVLVEVCLSSNDQILEVKGASHPLREYLNKKVPVALATDDQGVSRSSLAGEYYRAATDQKLTYRELKLTARNSLEHSFLPGASLWTAIDGAVPVDACAATDTMGVGDPASPTCQAFLDASEKATIEWELERRFREFESKQ